MDLILERQRGVLREGAVLVDTNDEGLSHAYCSISSTASPMVAGIETEDRALISRRLQFVEITRDGHLVNAGAAPYLDYSPLTAEQKPFVKHFLTSLAGRRRGAKGN